MYNCSWYERHIEKKNRKEQTNKAMKLILVVATHFIFQNSLIFP